jgi:serine/threonine protein kinase/lipoprotein NlpI
MSEQPLKIRQFQSLDDFRQWWWGDEVTQFCKDHPDQVSALKNHHFVKPYLEELERESTAGAEQQQVAPQPTTKTFGKYQLEKKLGQGGMGAVYLAFDPALNRRVALKIMALKGQEAIERFQREARASAKLKHPNITPVYEVGTQSKYHYFTMEYVEGASLDSQIQSKKLNPKRTAEVIRDIASALDYAHKQGIIHRDIKPANILIDSTGRPYLTDFGLAKETTGLEKSLTLSGTVVGTPDYMSPEQARGERRLDPRADIFSLGATLYHCLTGSVPFRGKELYQVLEQVVHKDPLPPSRLIRRLDPDLETICLKCMEKEPIQRYQACRELSEDLTRYLKGDVILAKPVSTVTKLYLKAKKNKLASIGIASAVVILLAVIIGLMVSSANKRKEIASHRANAQNAFADKDYDKAKEWCTKLLTLAPADEEIQSILKRSEDALKKQAAKSGEDKARAEAEAAKSKEAAEIRSKAKAVLDRIRLAKTPEDKLKIAQEALNIDQTFGEAWQEMGYAYKEKAGSRLAVRSPDEYRELIDKAVEAFTKAIELTPSLAYSYYERALINADYHNKQEEAISDFEKVLEYDPGSHIGNFAKGNIESDRKKYDKAIESYTRAIALSPDYVQAYHRRGLACYNKAREHTSSDGSPAELLDKAIADYTEVIRLDPKNIEGYYCRGLAYYDKEGRESRPDECRELMDRAIADYNAAIKTTESYSSIEIPGINIDTKESIIGAVSAIKTIFISPRLASIYCSRGIACEKKAEYASSEITSAELREQAMADYNQAIKINPKLAEPYNNRASIYARKAEREQNPDSRRELIDKAMADCDKAIILNHKSAAAFDTRAFVYIKKGDLEEAIADCDKAIALDPKYANAYYNRAIAYSNQDDFKAAIADGEQFLELAPNYPQAEQVKQLIADWRKKLK